jgi:hypothetical protein
MVYQDIVAEIEKLPLTKQLSLLETLTRLVSRRTANPAAPDSSLERVRGLLKPAPDQTIPTDIELTDDYTTYLLEKYT